MASPPNCPVCNSKVNVTNHDHFADTHGVSMVTFNCGHSAAVQNGAWVRITTASGKPSAGDQTTFEMTKASGTQKSARESFKSWLQ